MIPRCVAIFAVVAVASLIAGEAPREESKPSPSAADFEKELKEKLQRKISFEFAETPINEALMFFNSLTKLNIIYDENAFKDSKPVSLKVANVVMFDAFKQLLDKAGLEMQLGNDAIRIVTKGTPPREELKPLVPVAEWEKEICKKLQRKITFEFVDTPLSEGIVFLNSLSKVSFIVDPALAERETACSIKITDMSIENALMNILRLIDANVELVDGALFIFKNGAYVRKPPVPLTDEQAQQLKNAIPKLSSDDFDTREAAMTIVRGLGPGAVPLLEAEKKAGKDAETVARISTLIATIPRPKLIDEETPAVTKLLADPKLAGKTSFEFVDTPMEDAVQFLNSLSKVGVVLENNAKFRRVNMRGTDVDFASALRWLARLGGGKLTVENGALKIMKDKKQ